MVEPLLSMCMTSPDRSFVRSASNANTFPQIKVEPKLQSHNNDSAVKIQNMMLCCNLLFKLFPVLSGYQVPVLIRSKPNTRFALKIPAY